MRLLTKFNLALIAVFAVGVGIASYISRDFLMTNAREEVVGQARLMMSSAGAMRSYTSKQIQPLLTPQLRRVQDFIPQTVPAYSATWVFRNLRETYSTYAAYTYKEATLNPTNPTDRALDWEADIIESFRNGDKQTEVIGRRDTAQGESLFLAHPIKVVPSCLECHSTPDVAPASQTKTYGRDNGFGWKSGEVVGAQIVSVPMALPVAIAGRAFKTLLVSLAGVSLLTLVLVDLGLVLIVIRPVTRLSRAAEEISQGNMNVPEPPATGSDEIAQLARSFNRMYLSLKKAMQLLEG